MTAPLVPSRRTSELLWSITSTYNDTLARQKFEVFALISSLLVPNAAKLFRQALKDEREEIAHERRRLRMLRKQRREKDEPVRMQKLIDKLHAALFDSCYSPDATVKNISASLPPFPPPHWTGEPRPFGARQVRLRSNFPSADYLRYLVAKLGYRGDAAIAALSHAHEPWTKVSDRRSSVDNTREDAKTGEDVTYENSAFNTEHPYWPASPTLPTTSGGGVKKQRVTEAIAKHRWDDKTSTAIFEIVYMRRKPFLVAASLGLKLKTVYRYCSQVRADLRRGSAPKKPSETPKLRAKNSKSFVLKEGVLINA